MKEITLTLKIDDCEHHHHRHKTLNVPIGHFTQKENSKMPSPQAVSMTDAQKFQIGPGITAFDADLQPVPLAGALSFVTDNPLVTLDFSGGDGSCWVSGTPGTANVTVSDTVDTFVFAVTITATPEAGLNVPFSAPVAK